MTEALRPAEDMQAASASPSRPVRRRRCGAGQAGPYQGHQRHHQGGWRPFPRQSVNPGRNTPRLLAMTRGHPASHQVVKPL
jgi:hypothetical protein